MRSCSPFFRLIFFCLVSLNSQLFAADPAKSRWTDVEGRKIEAQMVGYANGLVTLKLKDGKTVDFPISKLRERDRDYVLEHAPIDLKTASREIDRMVWDKLKEANSEIKKQRAALLQKTDLDPAERNKELARLDHMEIMTHPTAPLSDTQFLRRVYLDIGGRIPTYEEAQPFLRSSDRNKREKLIDQLIESEAFVSHFFNFLSDLLRIRDGLSMGGFDNLKSGAYSDWVKDQIRSDRPWDELVTELLAAKGYLWDNPAVGYLLTDFGMELCNLSNTFTTFAGTEITCAQCHDHPFEEVFQIDFYRMAAFFGQLTFATPPDEAKLQAIKSQRATFAAAALKANQNIDGLNTLLSAYNISLSDGPESQTKLPFDYKYDNGEPHQKIQPGVYYGDNVKLGDYQGPREAFADWMTSKSNPRFTINIVNRLWKQVYGVAQIEPVKNIPGHLDGQAQNYELLKYLEQVMKEVDYSIKDFLKILYKTTTYQREACHKSPTLAMIDRGEFHFPAPVLRRMSAEQLWDSLVAMSVNDPEATSRQTRILEGYREIMNANWASMSYPEALELKKRYDQLGRGGMMMTQDNNRRNRSTEPEMKRASELPLPHNLGSFLSAFGQSDKKYIENGTRDGTIPQVMELLNGSLTNRIMASESKEMVRVAQELSSSDEGADVIFLSILSRRPTPAERDYVAKLVRGKGKSADYSDLVWALLNTHEFMFIQ